jgi:uncharacterized membrane protein YphA (DoxX/SURF4 family)
MKIITIIIRTVLGLLFLYTSVSYFLYLSPEPASTGEFKAFQVGLMFNLFIPTGKSVEFLCGLSFVTGKFTTLSNLVIFL